MSVTGPLSLFFVFLAAASFPTSARSERQLTTAEHGHVLTNINVWSPDGEWIVYDVRTGDEFDGEFIEQVNVRTGEVQRLYTAPHGACVGVVTYSPVGSRVAFIHGPENPGPGWTYHATRRGGSLVDPAHPAIARPLDAMNYAPPFAPGALRGGSHVHVFSPDGRWISFTYEDEVLARLDADSAAPPHEPNRRNIGVAVPAGPVPVAPSHPRNRAGDWFSVIVTRTVATPRPGSDEIATACEEGWIGREGYVRADGTRQRRALAFLGLVTPADGAAYNEVYVVDLPDDMTVPGAAPLGGTATTYPAPPLGVTQRRLTFTAGRKFPGVVRSPRHWLRASPDGTRIAFLMRDDAGVVQFFTVPPNGGEPHQLTHNTQGVASAFTWSPDGTQLAHVMDGSICVTDAITGRTERLTPRREGADAPSALACVFSPDGRAIAYTREIASSGGRFPQIFTVTIP